MQIKVIFDIIDHRQQAKIENKIGFQVD